MTPGPQLQLDARAAPLGFRSPEVGFLPGRKRGPNSQKSHGLERGVVRALGRTEMFDDCIILGVRLGERLVFPRNLASRQPPSPSELRRMFDDLREIDELVRDFGTPELGRFG